MNNKFTAAQIDKISAALKLSFHVFQDEDGVYEVSAVVAGQQVALAVSRSRAHATAQVKAEVADLIEALAFNLRTEVAEVPAR